LIVDKTDLRAIDINSKKVSPFFKKISLPPQHLTPQHLNTSTHPLQISHFIQKTVWKISYFAIVNWGYSANLFQVIFHDTKKKKQTASFGTTKV
jgi:hypothetical protein